jgi:hypothetical protein
MWLGSAKRARSTRHRAAEQTADHWQAQAAHGQIRRQRVPQIVSKSSRGPAANRTHDKNQSIAQEGAWSGNECNEKSPLGLVATPLSALSEVPFGAADKGAERGCCGVNLIVVRAVGKGARPPVWAFWN